MPGKPNRQKVGANGLLSNCPHNACPHASAFKGTGDPVVLTTKLRVVNHLPDGFATVLKVGDFSHIATRLHIANRRDGRLRPAFQELSLPGPMPFPSLGYIHSSPNPCGAATACHLASLG